MTNEIFVLHGHHDCLISYLNIEERIKDIRENKPENEIKTRLRLLKPVDENLLPAKLVKADKARDKAWEKARDKAWEKADKARDEAREKADKARYEADKALDKAYKVWKKAEKAWKKHKPELEALHKKLCGCKEWNGKKLVFE